MIRCNQDVKLNVTYREVVYLCKSPNLRICNGRTVGDLCGDFTTTKDRGKSVVDYTIVGKNFLRNILHLKIGEPTYLSDHNLVETIFKCQIKRDTSKVKISNMRKAYDKFIWQVRVISVIQESIETCRLSGHDQDLFWKYSMKRAVLTQLLMIPPLF